MDMKKIEAELDKLDPLDALSEVATMLEAEGMLRVLRSKYAAKARAGVRPVKWEAIVAAARASRETMNSSLNALGPGTDGEKAMRSSWRKIEKKQAAARAARELEKG